MYDMTNPLLRVQMADREACETLRKTPDPRLAEQLLNKRLQTIGLLNDEIRILMMKYGYMYPLYRVMQETGLTAETIDKLHDDGIEKINSYVDAKPEA